MIPFSLKWTCPKCDCEHRLEEPMNNAYDRHGHSVLEFESFCSRLMWTCVRCDHQEEMACKDTKEATP